MTNQPRDPRVAELAALLGRRRLLGVAGAASLGAVGLAACGTAGTGSSSAPAASGSAPRSGQRFGDSVRRTDRTRQV